MNGSIPALVQSVLHNSSARESGLVQLLSPVGQYLLSLLQAVLGLDKAEANIVLPDVFVGRAEERRGRDTLQLAILG